MRVRSLTPTWPAWPVWLVLAGGCGLDALASGPVEATLTGEHAEGAAGDGATSGEDGGSIFLDGAATDASGNGTTPEAGPGEVLEIAISNAPNNLDVSAEGTIDWAHWGYLQSAEPIRKATGGGVIGNYTVTGSSLTVGSNSGATWPVSAEWNDGDSRRSSESGTDTFRYFTGSPDTAIAWSVPAAPTRRTLTFYIAIGQAKARVTAKLTGTTATTTNDQDSGAAASKFLRVAIAYASPTPGTRVEVGLRMVMRHNTSVYSALSFGSATLR